MTDDTDDTNYPIRRSTKTQRKIDEIRKITQPKAALEKIADLFENYINLEEKVPVKYNQKTGKPVKFEWKPSKDESRFKREIYLGGESLIDPDPTEPGLAKVVVEEMKKKGPILVNTKFGKYVFIYEEERDESGITEELISVRKVREL